MKFDLKFASRFSVLLLGLPLSFNTMAAMSANVGGPAVLIQDLNNAQRLHNTSQTQNTAPAPAKSMPLTTAADFSNGTMRGFNTGNINLDGSDNYVESDFADLASMKVNLVRTAIDLKRCKGCSSFDSPDIALARVEHILQEGQSRGFKVVVVLAIPYAPGETTEKAYWKDDALRASIVTTWQKIATKLKSYPALAAYDLLNEPVPPDVGTKNMQQQVWIDFAKTLVRSIRSVDPDHVIIFEPAPWASADDFRNMQPLPFTNIVYSFHFYYPYPFTMQGLNADAPLGVMYPNANLNKASLSKGLEQVRDFVKRTNAPVYVGEFGALRWAPNDSTYRYLKDVTELFEAEKWSWTFYSYRGYHGFDAEVPYNASRGITFKEERGARVAHTNSIDLLRSYFSYNKLP